LTARLSPTFGSLSSRLLPRYSFSLLSARYGDDQVTGTPLGAFILLPLALCWSPRTLSNATLDICGPSFIPFAYRTINWKSVQQRTKVVTVSECPSHLVTRRRHFVVSCSYRCICIRALVFPLCACTDTSQRLQRHKGKMDNNNNNNNIGGQLPTPRTLLFRAIHSRSCLAAFPLDERVVNKRSRGCLQGLFGG
jgi:hypothetical protein